MEEVFEFFSRSYNELSWFFELGYVVIIATILSMVFTQIWKKTILKKALVKASDSQKDKILGGCGTITSLVIYGVVYVANEMITQHTFSIVIEWHSAWAIISSGAAVTWVAAKGLYTVIHKAIQRHKEGKSLKENADAIKKDLNEVEKAVKAETSKANTIDKSIGGTKKIL